jgi:peptide/nickel transport system permease protein
MMHERWRQLRRNKAALTAGAVISLFLLAAVAAPAVAPSGPLEGELLDARQAPSPAHPLGTDGQGRDVLSRIIFGARISFEVAGVAVAIALAIGTVLGVLAGYLGRWVDEVISRAMDMIFAVPAIVLALVIMAALGPSRWNLMVAIGVVYTPIFARVARGAVLSVKGEMFIEAARACGCSAMRIMTRHICPNIVAPVAVQTTLSLAFAILAEAALSFLGLGVEADAPSWGNMLLEGKDLMREAWWVAVFPGLAITLLVLALNVLGDGLRDALDPRTAD